jgi:hypothetical protein
MKQTSDVAAIPGRTIGATISRGSAAGRAVYRDGPE